MFLQAKPIAVPLEVMEVCSILYDHSFQVYLVGGAVRDSLRNLTPTDWDVVTDALPEQVESLYPRTIPTGKKFGTITVLHNQKTFEITTFRKEGRYLDQRHPDSVAFGQDVTTDLSRRDFTVNAIAYHPFRKEYIDPFGGRRDLRKRLLRTVGAAKERFSEDPLRMLRCFRFMATLQFTPDKAAVSAMDPALLAKISRERIGAEITKLVLAPEVVPTFELMHSTRVLAEILPELAACQGIYQGDRHRYDVLGHSLVTTQAIKPELHLRLAALFHDVGKAPTFHKDHSGIHFHGHDKLGAEITRLILKRLRFDKRLVERVSNLVRYHMFAIHPHSTDKAIRRFAAKVGEQNIYDFLELRRADIMGMHFNPRQAMTYGQAMAARLAEVLSSESVLSVKDLAIGGKDILKEFPLSPGPQVGKILNFLLDQVLEDPNLNNRDSLLELASKWYQARAEDEKKP